MIQFRQKIKEVSNKKKKAKTVYQRTIAFFIAALILSTSLLSSQFAWAMPVSETGKYETTVPERDKSKTVLFENSGENLGEDAVPDKNGSPEDVVAEPNDKKGSQEDAAAEPSEESNSQESIASESSEESNSQESSTSDSSEESNSKEAESNTEETTDSQDKSSSETSAESVDPLSKEKLPKADNNGIYTFKEGSISVKATIDKGIKVPDDMKLKVRQILPPTELEDEEDDEYQASLDILTDWAKKENDKSILKDAPKEKAESEESVESTDLVAESAPQPAKEIYKVGAVDFFEIGFVSGDKKVSPHPEADIELSFKDDDFKDKKDLALFKYVDGEIKREEASEISADKDGNVIAKFKTDSFSKYAIASIKNTEKATPIVRAPAPGTIQTADSRADGITMHLFDYEGWWQDGNRWKDLEESQNVPNNANNSNGIKNVGINYNHALKFTAYGVLGNTLNHFTGENKAQRTGIVKKMLGTDGYPVLSGGNESLKYLFDTNNIASAKTTYKDVNHLMTKDTQGTYKFDSNKNYAYYRPGQGNSGNFKVYNGTYPEADGRYQVGFFPFNDWQSSGTDYNNVNNPKGPYNHHFGMTMSAAFSLPKNGKLPNGQDMVFEYSGDDDMWLYIDDVLVLDIGGIHEPVHGTINFATGVVRTWPENATWDVTETTLKKIFEEQGVNWKNDTDHEFNMFYLERGGQYSNLSLTLNIPIVKTVTVKKVVEGTFSEDYLNTDFSFQALVDKGDGEYVPYQGNIEKGSTTTYVDDGKFTLEPTESAKLLDMKSSWKYKIVELDLDGSEFGEVKIEGSGATTHILSDGQTGIEASSDSVDTGTDSNNNLTFKNKIREEKGDILVRKIWEGDGGTHPNGIQFKLYQIKNGDTVNKVLYKDAQGNSIFTLNNASSWKKEFKNLIKKSGSDVYTYEVEEVSVPNGYIVSYSDSATSNQTGNFDITNKKRTKVEVEKKWLNSDGTELTTDLPDKVTVQLYQYKMKKVAQQVPGPPPSTEQVKVIFRSKYYGWTPYYDQQDNGHYADGNNHAYNDKGHLKADSINEEVTRYVTKGGSITFTVKTRTAEMGIHEVYKNRNGGASGTALTAANPKDTTEIRQWLGRNSAYNWEDWHPMRTQGTYTLTNLTAPVTYVDVDIIGYLWYGPNNSGTWVPSLRDSFDYLNVKTTESSGGTTTIYVPPTPPAEMPAIGTAGLSTYGSPVELKAGTGWKTVFDNLPVQANDGDYYFYYVKEEPAIPGFTATYEGNGSSGGNITVKNTRETIEIPVEKKWSDQSSNDHSGTTITVKLLKKVGNNWEDTGKKVELNNGNGWSNKFEKLPKFDKQGNLIEYKIEEVSVDGYISVITPQKIENVDGFRITNKLSEIEILKKDADDENKIMEGVKFSLYKEESCQTKVKAYTNPQLSGDKVDEFVIGDDGKTSIYGLASGEYWLKEEETLSGYKLPDKAFHIKIDSEGKLSILGDTDEDIELSGNNLGFVIKNHIGVTSLKIIKKDALKGSILLKGAKFSLYEDEACNNIVEAYKDKELNQKETVFETDTHGFVEIYGLKPGTYYLKEIKAPDGYVLITKPIKLTLDKDGKITLGASYGFASVQENVNSGTIQLEITNRKPEYPDTGGRGSGMYLGVGGALMILSAGILWMRRKFEKNKA